MPGADKPVALVTAPFTGEGLDTLRSVCDVVLDPWIDHQPLRLYDGAALAERIEAEGASVVICEADNCKGPVLDLPLLAIGSTRGDPTNVDVAGATERGIPVLHAPGRNADGVAEITVALLFAVNRHLLAADRDVRAGEIYRDGTIPYQRFRAWQLAGRTAGIVGLGAVGRATRWRLEGLGMRVIAHDPYNDEATHSLDELLAEADVVSMHAMVSPESLGMMGAEQFAAMKPTAYFITTARGPVHDEDALYEALTTGRIAGAGLDVFHREPPDPAHPLLALDNVVASPHTAGITEESTREIARATAEQWITIFAGRRAPRIVNPEVWPQFADRFTARFGALSTEE